MPYTAPPTKNAGDVLTSALWNTYIRDNFDAGVMRMLADTTVTGSVAASIDFTSIPATFAHLMLVVYGRGDNAATLTNLNIRFNNDSAGNYDVQSLYGNAATPLSGEALAATMGSVGIMPGNTAGANLFSQHDIVIPHYASAANNKIARSVWAAKLGTATGNVYVGSHMAGWRSSAAINRITLLATAGNLAIGTRATLYGLPA